MPPTSSSGDPPSTSPTSYTLEFTGNLKKDFSYLKSQKFKPKTKYNLKIGKKSLKPVQRYLSNCAIDGSDMKLVKKILLLSIKDIQLNPSDDDDSSISSLDDEKEVQIQGTKRARSGLKKNYTSANQFETPQEVAAASPLMTPTKTKASEKSWISRVFGGSKSV